VEGEVGIRAGVDGRHTRDGRVHTNIPFVPRERPENHPALHWFGNTRVPLLYPLERDLFRHYFRRNIQQTVRTPFAASRIPMCAIQVGGVGGSRARTHPRTAEPLGSGRHAASSTTRAQLRPSVLLTRCERPRGSGGRGEGTRLRHEACASRQAASPSLPPPLPAGSRTLARGLNHS